MVSRLQVVGGTHSLELEAQARLVLSPVRVLNGTLLVSGSSGLIEAELRLVIARQETRQVA